MVPNEKAKSTAAEFTENNLGVTVMSSVSVRIKYLIYHPSPRDDTTSKLK